MNEQNVVVKWYYVNMSYSFVNGINFGKEKILETNQHI